MKIANRAHWTGKSSQASDDWGNSRNLSFLLNVDKEERVCWGVTQRVAELNRKSRWDKRSKKFFRVGGTIFRVCEFEFRLESRVRLNSNLIIDLSCCEIIIVQHSSLFLPLFNRTTPKSVHVNFLVISLSCSRSTQMMIRNWMKIENSSLIRHGHQITLGRVQHLMRTIKASSTFFYSHHHSSELNSFATETA